MAAGSRDQNAPVTFYNALKDNNSEIVTNMLLEGTVDANIMYMVMGSNYAYVAAGEFNPILFLMFADTEQASAIDIATYFQSIGCMKVLLQNGVSKDTLQNKIRPLLTACENDFVDGMKLLISYGANPNVQDTHNGITVVHYCAAMGSNTCLQVLLTSPLVISCYHDNTPLHTWAKSCKIDEHTEYETLRLLLKHGFDVDCVNKKGETPLMLVTSLDLSGKAKALIQKGASINAVSCIGETSLHRVCLSGAFNCIPLLVPQIASINATNVSGYTALDLALQYLYRFGPSEHGTPKFDAKVAVACLKLLLNHGGIPHEFNSRHLEQIVRRNPDTIDAFKIFINSVAYFDTTNILTTIFEDMEIFSQQQKDILSILQLLAAGPRSLRHLSRCAVRRCLGPRIYRDTTTLPLPPCIKMYICLEGPLEIN
ncbi:ankyrin repeat and SOCS box protein 16-like [Glandiceps talaboti]